MVTYGDHEVSLRLPPSGDGVFTEIEQDVQALVLRVEAAKDEHAADTDIVRICEQIGHSLQIAASRLELLARTIEHPLRNTQDEP